MRRARRASVPENLDLGVVVPICLRVIMGRTTLGENAAIRQRKVRLKMGQ